MSKEIRVEKVSKYVLQNSPEVVLNLHNDQLYLRSVHLAKNSRLYQLVDRDTGKKYLDATLDLRSTTDLQLLTLRLEEWAIELTNTVDESTYHLKAMEDEQSPYLENSAGHPMCRSTIAPENRDDNHNGSHYRNGKMEAIEVIEAFPTPEGLTEGQKWARQNVIKYILRAGHKQGVPFEEDMKKIMEFASYGFQGKFR